MAREQERVRYERPKRLHPPALQQDIDIENESWALKTRMQVRDSFLIAERVLLSLVSRLHHEYDSC